MNRHLKEIAKAVAPGAHAALVLDGAGWHGSADLVMPENITPIILPALLPGTQSRRKRLGIFAQEQARELALRNPRGHRRGLRRSWGAGRNNQRCKSAWRGLAVSGDRSRPPHRKVRLKRDRRLLRVIHVVNQLTAKTPTSVGVGHNKPSANPTIRADGAEHFEQDPSGLPFDWQITRGLNSVAEFLPLCSEGEQALHVSLGIGSVQFPEVSQIVLLASGKYRLGGKLRGSIIAKRDLR